MSGHVYLQTHSWRKCDTMKKMAQVCASGYWCIHVISLFVCFHTPVCNPSIPSSLGLRWLIMVWDINIVTLALPFQIASRSISKYRSRPWSVMVTIWKQVAYWWFIVSEQTPSIFSSRPGTETEKEHYLASPKTRSVNKGSSHSMIKKGTVEKQKKRKKQLRWQVQGLPCC